MLSGKRPRRERERVPEPVEGLRRVLAEEVVRRVAVVADGHGVMARLQPPVVLLVHHVAVGARGRIVRQVRAASGVDEGIEPKADEQPKHDVAATSERFNATLHSIPSPPPDRPDPAARRHASGATLLPKGGPEPVISFPGDRTRDDERHTRRHVGRAARAAVRVVVEGAARPIPLELRVSRRRPHRLLARDEPRPARRGRGARAAHAAQLPQVRAARSGAAGFGVELARARAAPRAADAAARLDVLAVRRAALRDRARRDVRRATPSSGAWTTA